MDARCLVSLLVALFWGIAAGRAQTPPGVELVAQTGHTAGVAAVAYRPAETQCLTASTDGTAILWDVRTGRQLRTYRGGPLTNSFLTVAELKEIGMAAQFPLAAKQTPAVSALEFSRDGRSFIMACRPDGFLAALDANSQAIVWDVESGKRLKTFDLPLGAGAISLSPDGTRLLVGGQPLDPAEAGEIAALGVHVNPSTGATLWDIATGQTLRQFGGHDATYETVQFSPDGRFVLAGGRTISPAPNPSAPPADPPVNPPSGVLYVWNANTGEQVLKIQPPNGVRRAEFSPTGDMLVLIDAANLLEVWDIAAKQRRLNVQAAIGVFSADGKQVVGFAPGGRISVWDIAQGQAVREFLTQLDGVEDIALSADGARLLVGITHRAASSSGAKPSGASASGQVVIVNLTTGNVFGSFFARTDPLGFVAVSPTGRYLLIGDGLWDTATGGKLTNLCTDPVQAFSAAFSPDERLALIANHPQVRFPVGMDRGLMGSQKGLLASIKTIPAGEDRAKLESDQPVDNQAILGFNADGTCALTAVPFGRMAVWDVASGQKRAESAVSGGSLVAAFSPDGHRAAVSFQEMKTLWWDSVSGEPAAETPREKGPASRPGVPPQTTRDKKQQIVVADDGLGIVVQDVASPDVSRAIQVKLTPHQGIHAAGFDARDERFVYAEISSPFVGLWDIDADKRLKEFAQAEPFPPEMLRFVPDGNRVASAGNEGRVAFWDAATGARISSVALESPITALAFSADGQRFVAGCADRTAVVVQMATGQKIVLSGHAGPVDAAAFRPDGAMVVTASREDGTARIWSVGAGKELARIISIGNRADWLVITPDGRYDGSEEGRKLVAFRVGVGLEVRPSDQFSAEFTQPQPGLLGKIWSGQ